MIGYGSAPKRMCSNSKQRAVGCQAVVRSMVHSCSSHCRADDRYLNVDRTLVHASFTPRTIRRQRDTPASSEHAATAQAANSQNHAWEELCGPARILDNDEPSQHSNQQLCSLLPPIFKVYELRMTVDAIIQMVLQLPMHLPSRTDNNELMWRYRSMCASMRSFQVCRYLYTHAQHLALHPSCSHWLEQNYMGVYVAARAPQQ